MQIAEAYCENGPLHGRTMVVKELLQMQLNGGFYMRNEFQASTTQGQKNPLYLWLGAEDWNVQVNIGESSQAVTIDSARIDRNGVTWMRLRHVGVDLDLYKIWKQTADKQADMSVVFQGQTYLGRTDVVGKNDVDGYMFLHSKDGPNRSFNQQILNVNKHSKHFADEASPVGKNVAKISQS